MPLTNNAFTLNGIVSNSTTPSTGTCTGDDGWRGVAAKEFDVTGMSPTSRTAKFMLAGYDGTGEGVVDELYVGVQVDGDPELFEQDFLTLWFDRDGNGGEQFANGDVALVFRVGNGTPIDSGEDCSEDLTDSGDIQLFRWDGSTWQNEGTPAGVDASAAYDYDSNDDAETEIWELEIRINPGELGLAVPASGQGFAVGARLLVHEQGAGLPEVFNWPSGLLTNSLAIQEPIIGGVTPDDLATARFDDCADVVIDEITAEDRFGNSNKFTRPEMSEFNSGTLPDALRNRFKATVRFFNPNNPTDSSPVASPNTGTVDFVIRPWNGGFLDEYTMASPMMSFDQLNQTSTVETTWPQTTSQWTTDVATKFSSGHACLKVSLNGFTVNLDEPGDKKTRNLSYFEMSTRVDTFIVSTEEIRPPEGEKAIEYLLRARWVNLPEAVQDGWSYKFLADDLEQVEENYYRLTMEPGEERFIPIQFTGGEMPGKTQTLRVPPTAGGQILEPQSGKAPVVVQVEPGQMITIVANGLARFDQNDKQRPTGPNGYTNRELDDLKRFLLQVGPYDPSHYVGTLIGSFDKFETSFVIGADESFLVPEDAEQLYLAVNDLAGRYEDNEGDGFTVHLVSTEPAFLPTRIATVGDPSRGIPPAPAPGANLPTLNVDVFQIVPLDPEVEAKYDQMLMANGYVSYAVYSSSVGGSGGDARDGNGGGNGGGDAGGADAGSGEEENCGSSSTSGTIVFVFALALGLPLVWRRTRRSAANEENGHA
jgi:hypothetical protein